MFTQVKNALIVVDVQHDFAHPTGALSVRRGMDVIPFINKIVKDYELVIFTRDWHPEDTDHFERWPVHCVADSEGAQFAKGLNVPRHALIYNKGTNVIEDGYSPFTSGTFDAGNLDGESISEYLTLRGVRNIDVVGLATDYCVKATAIDAVKWGFNSRVLLAGCRAVDDPSEALDEMWLNHVEIVWR